MLIINLRLGLSVLCIFPVLIAATVCSGPSPSRAYSESRDKVAAVNADFAENVAGLRVTQAFRREGTNQDRFGGAQRGRSGRRGCGPSATSRCTSRSCRPCPRWPAPSCWSSPPARWPTATLTAGALIAYLLYIDMVFAPVQQLSQVFDGYQQAMVGLRRITDLLRLGTSTPRRRHPVMPGGCAAGSSCGT